MASRYNSRVKPEDKVRDDIRDLLDGYDWRTHIMHGNAYQYGIPDLYAIHAEYGTRWIDAKVEKRYRFTKAQKQLWPIWHFRYKVGIWILTAGTATQYGRLFQAPNWLDYWKDSWGDPRNYLNGPDIDSILDTIKE